eukprot:scaffold170_cov281-Pinguiococcus_pyrenoidosus.AAC.2
MRALMMRGGERRRQRTSTDKAEELAQCKRRIRPASPTLHLSASSCHDLGLSCPRSSKIGVCPACFPPEPVVVV